MGEMETHVLVCRGDGCCTHLQRGGELVSYHMVEMVPRFSLSQKDRAHGTQLLSVPIRQGPQVF